MTHVLRDLTVLCLALAPVVASAEDPRSDAAGRAMREDMEMETAARTGERPEIGEPPCLPLDPDRVRTARHLTLYQDAPDQVPEVSVAGGVATIIWLPSKLVARETRIAAAEGRFQLLKGGNQIVITPTRQLAE